LQGGGGGRAIEGRGGGRWEGLGRTGECRIWRGRSRGWRRKHDHQGCWRDCSGVVGGGIARAEWCVGSGGPGDVGVFRWGPEMRAEGGELGAGHREVVV